MKAQTTLMFLLVLLLSPATLLADDLKTTTGKIAHQPASVVDGPVAREKLQRDVEGLLHQEKFAELETLARRFRASKERFPEGHWKLAYFYRSMHAPTRRRVSNWEQHFALLEQWQKQYPRSVTARVATAQAWLAYGYQARGGGYANSVKAEGWKRLNEGIAKAYDLAKEAPPKGEPDCPGRYGTLLVIARTQGWPMDRFKATFEAAVRLEPEYLHTYVDAMAYLLPQWQGDGDSLLSFIEQADALSGNPQSKELYARLMVGRWGETWTEFDDFRVSWSKMKKGYRDMEKKFPGSQYNLNNFAKFACVAGDSEVGKELLQRIGDAPYFDIWDGGAPTFEQCRKKFGLSGLTRAEIEEARKNQEAVQRRLLAEQGDVSSQYWVGLDYSAGKNSDYTVALRFLRAAADNGSVPALSQVGQMYFHGQGVPADRKAGLELLEQAAKLGDDSARDSLPGLYLWQNNRVRAYAWSKVTKEKKESQERMRQLEKMLSPSEMAQAEEQAEQIIRQLKR